jgi:hypothetical protein
LLLSPLVAERLAGIGRRSDGTVSLEIDEIQVADPGPCPLLRNPDRAEAGEEQ